MAKKNEFDTIVNQFLADCRKIHENGGELDEWVVLMCEERYRSYMPVLMDVEDQVKAIWCI